MGRHKHPTRIVWGPNGPDFWKDYESKTISERRKFLKKNGFNKRNVPHCIDCRHPFYHCVCHDVEWQARKKLKVDHLYAPFEEKLSKSLALKDQVMAAHKGKKIWLAYSGGIDSECCARLFKDEIKNGEVRVMWNDTLVELPETRKTVENFEKEFGIKVLRLTPIGWSFKKVVETYGLPMYARSAYFDKRLATERCCFHLKKEPPKHMTEKIEVLIMGLRIKESRYRAKAIFRYGDHYYSKSTSQWRVYPVAYWTTDDAWAYQAKEKFPYNPIYDYTNMGKKGMFKLSDGRIYQIRTGCWSCPQGIRLGYLEWLKAYYPRYHHALLFNFGLLPRLVELRKTELRFRKAHICGLDDEEDVKSNI